MAESDGHFDAERRFELLEEMIRGLIEHATLTDKEIEKLWQAAEKLRQSQQETNASVQSLVGAIRDLIDRIPPESLR